MYEIVKKLPASDRVREEAALSEELALRKKSFDRQIVDLIEKRNKLAVVVGPCAADNVSAVREYVRGLKELADKFPSLFVIARIYTSKPHSDGTGYGGMVFGDGDIVKGIVDCRKMMLDCLSVGLPVADEILYPSIFPYFSDLVSYAFVGARSSEDTLHRGVASCLDIACGVKNGTDGNICKAVDSLNAVANPCVFPLCGNLIESDGNKFAHVVLRGGIVGGKFVSNIDEHSVAETKKLLAERGLNDFVMADLSHANSGKIALRQIENARIAAQNPCVNGVMAESYLFDGKGGGYGVSQTDECLGLANTAKLLQILNDGFCKRFE